MSVVSVKEIWSGRNGGVDGQTSQALRRYVRVYRVQTNDPNDGVFTVMNASDGATSIPSLWSVYSTPNESDAGAWCSDIRPIQSSQDPRFWEVQVQYDGFVNPLLEPPDIKWSQNRTTAIAELDIFLHPILNSAGCFFDPPPERDFSRMTCEITINQEAFDANAAIAYQDAINSDSLSIAGMSVAPYQAKLNISSTYNQNLAFVWWSTTYTIEFRRETWIKNILDQGRYKKSGSTVTPCTDASSNAVDDPVPLDGSGGQLANPSPTTAVYKQFHVYTELAFSTLLLPP